MASKDRSTKEAAKNPDVDHPTKEELQISVYEDGFLIKGVIDQSHAGLKDFATWNEHLGGWTISKRRAYEYDHHYGLSLFYK